MADQLTHFRHLEGHHVSAVVASTPTGLEQCSGELTGLYEINGEYSKLPFANIKHGDGRRTQLNLGKVITISDMGPIITKNEDEEEDE